MKFRFFILLIMIKLNCLGQKAAMEQNKLTNLFAQALEDLSKNREGKITYPFISGKNFIYIKNFVKDGGLNDLKEKQNWMFINEVDTLIKLPYQKFEERKIKKRLISKNIKIQRFKKEKLTFTPFIFSNDLNKACFIFEEVYFSTNNTATKLNTIICFYEYINHDWIRIYAWPVSID